jgi:hypothetical protein
MRKTIFLALKWTQDTGSAFAVQELAAGAPFGLEGWVVLSWWSTYHQAEQARSLYETHYLLHGDEDDSYIGEAVEYMPDNADHPLNLLSWFIKNCLTDLAQNTSPLVITPVNDEYTSLEVHNEHAHTRLGCLTPSMRRAVYLMVAKYNLDLRRFAAEVGM